MSRSATFFEFKHLAERINEGLGSLEPEERLEVLFIAGDGFCKSCGNVQPRQGERGMSCPCDNDE